MPLEGSQALVAMYMADVQVPARFTWLFDLALFCRYL
jgi:hypothetical protein